MKKFKIAHYQKGGSMWFVNGGKLIITENKFTVKYLFRTVLSFDTDKTTVSRISTDPLYNGIRLSDGVKETDIYFFKKAADELYEIFDI